MLFFCRSVLCTSGSTQNAEQCPTRMGRETNHTCHSQDCVRSARGNLTHQTCRKQTASNTSIPEKDGGKSVCPSPLVRQKGRRAALGFFKVPFSRMWGGKLGVRLKNGKGDVILSLGILQMFIGMCYSSVVGMVLVVFVVVGPVHSRGLHQALRVCHHSKDWAVAPSASIPSQE